MIPDVGDMWLPEEAFVSSGIMRNEKTMEEKKQLVFSSHALEMIDKRGLGIDDVNNMLRITRGNKHKYQQMYPHITNKFGSHHHMDFALVDKIKNIALMCAGNVVVTALYADGAAGYRF